MEKLYMYNMDVMPAVALSLIRQTISTFSTGVPEKFLMPAY